MKDKIRRIATIGFFLTSILLASAEAQASHEPFEFYETWDTAAIRSDRWQGGETFGGQEVERAVEVGEVSNNLQMRFRRQGEASSDTGVSFSNNFLNVTKPLSVDQLEAEFQAVSLTVTHCAANPQASRARAGRLLLTRFNDGSSGGPGDRTGDHIAGIQAQRDSDSADPDGVLTVVGFLSRCGDPACSFAFSTTVSFTVQALLSRVLRAPGLEGRAKVLKPYHASDVLILDEFGYLPADPDIGPILYEVIATRYEKKATLITSNKSLTEWGRVLHDTALAAALVDRLLHHGEVYYLKGDSYRLRGKPKTESPEPAETAVQGG